MTESRPIAVPPCWSTTVKAGRNRSRQVLVPAQSSTILGTDDAPIVALSDGQAVRIVRGAQGLADGERALKMAVAVLDAEATLIEGPSLSWLGSRNATSPNRVLESLEGRFAL
jgi:hypothetical protein